MNDNILDYYGELKKNLVPTARLGSCPDPGLNRGHLDLQSNALPTELPRPTDRPHGLFSGHGCLPYG